MEPRKQAIIAALRTFMNQRSGIDFRDYGDVKAFRAEQRSITKDLHHARELMRAVELSSITADDLLKASKGAFSGRLTIRTNFDWRIAQCDASGKPEGWVTGFVSEGAARDLVQHWRDCGNVTLADRARIYPPRNNASIDYVTGQYGPTEYRRAVCAVLASALWEYTRDKCKPEPTLHHNSETGETLHRYKGMRAGDWLRAHFRQQFGRGIASRWFS